MNTNQLNWADLLRAYLKDCQIDSHKFKKKKVDFTFHDTSDQIPEGFIEEINSIIEKSVDK